MKDCIVLGAFAKAERDNEFVLSVPLSDDLAVMTRIATVMTPHEFEVISQVLRRAVEESGLNPNPPNGAGYYVVVHQ